MNIVTKSTLLLTATLITGLISIQSHASVFGSSSKYVIVPTGKDGSMMWFLNTETGSTRICYTDFVDSSPRPKPKPKCGPWTKVK